MWTIVREERNILALGDFFTLKKSLGQTRPGRRPRASFFASEGFLFLRSQILLTLGLLFFWALPVCTMIEGREGDLTTF